MRFSIKDIFLKSNTEAVGQDKAKVLIPKFCCFGIVDECMFKCKMCFKWKDDINVRENHLLPFNIWEKAIYDLKRIVPKPKDFVINFGGGEALLRDDLLELVKVASKEGFTTNIASNGWLIDKTMAAKIAKSGLSSINLSLDSLKPEVHDDLRGKKGAANQVLKAIDYLRESSSELEIGICSVIYNINFNDILSLVKWVNQNKKINWILLMAAMQPNNTEVNPAWYKENYSYLWPKNRFKIMMLLNYLKLLKRCHWKIQNSYEQLDAFIKYFSHPDKFVKNRPCNMDTAIHISATGDFFSCFRWDKIGNIASMPLDEMWHSQLASKARDNIRGCKDNCHFLLNCFFEGDYPFGVKRHR